MATICMAQTGAYTRQDFCLVLQGLIASSLLLPLAGYTGAIRKKSIFQFFKLSYNRVARSNLAL